MQGDDKTIPSLGGRWPFNHEHCTRDHPTYRNIATLLIFQQGVNCAQSKDICSEFIKTNPEGDIEQLADQLTGLQISK